MLEVGQGWRERRVTVYAGVRIGHGRWRRVGGGGSVGTNKYGTVCGMYGMRWYRGWTIGGLCGAAKRVAKWGFPWGTHSQEPSGRLHSPARSQVVLAMKQVVVEGKEVRLRSRPYTRSS